MSITLKDGMVYEDGRFVRRDIAVSNSERQDSLVCDACFCSSSYSCRDFVVLPGFADIHVHLREPGFSYKEDIQTGTAAAARGGYTTVCAMPNLNPVPDCVDNIKMQISMIKEKAKINVIPYAAITVGEKGQRLSDMEELAPYCVAFSDDGKGVQSSEMMREAMKRAKKLGKIIAAHCEDESLLHGGCVHKGKYAKANGLPGICSESEWGQIKRDLELVRETGCAYHVCHISTKESVKLIREAKKDGLDVTCETAPHYLLLTDDDLKDEGRFKMNPPLRERADRDALIEGVLDGTIDIIATDHAPHSNEEKSRGLLKSAFGIVGLETAFPLLYTKLVKKNIISLERLVELMSMNPRKRFGITEGEHSGVTVFDLNREYKINPDEFLTKGRATPFEGMEVFGRCMATIYNGKLVWADRDSEFSRDC